MKRKSFVVQLNERYRLIIKEKKKQDFQIDQALKELVNDHPYRFLTSTKCIYPKVFFNFMLFYIV